jgi:hypothetical protein
VQTLVLPNKTKQNKAKQNKTKQNKTTTPTKNHQEQKPSTSKEVE